LQLTVRPADQDMRFNGMYWVPYMLKLSGFRPLLPLAHEKRPS